MRPAFLFLENLYEDSALELPRNSPRTNDMKLLHLHHMHMYIYIYAHTYIVYTYTHTHVYAYALARETGFRTRNPGEIVPKELRLTLRAKAKFEDEIPPEDEVRVKTKSVLQYSEDENRS